MRKLFTLFTSILLCSSSLWSQQKNGKISGSVQDNTGKPLQSITVSLVKAKDSSVIKFAVTGKDGKYDFDHIAEGNYRISLSSIGYEKKFSESFGITSASNPIQLDPLQMAEAARGMTGVTVVAKKPFIETRIDKTIVNVESSPTSAGATAMEVLEKSPGVTVDNDGNISLRGKSGVNVMVDGKPTHLSSTDLATMLKNMPASALDQIEIMTNPSARYDASGNSGVINIKTKKGKAAGFNGSVMAGVTTSIFHPDGDKTYVISKSQNSINFNWRKNKINFFGNYNPNFFKGRGQLSINRKFIDNNSNITGFSDVLTQFKFGNNNHTLKLGLDYSPDKKNSFGVVVSGFNFSGHPTPVTTTTISDEYHNALSSMVSLTENKIKFQNLSSNFNFRHVFDTTGQELTADLDYIIYRNVSNMLLTTDFYNPMGQTTSSTLYLQGHLPSNIHIFSAKSDYTLPFKKGGRFEAGVKTSFVKNDNLVDYERQVAD
ncbi:MAG TPA: outer membrane beta-barrel protein, partial [Chitinophagaceae bacterium]|nr:outer membrane beta-barrel protein [Chitinophagaceae bacterium]